ncbi:MAG: radical SAM protein [Endomicrobiaceae bacterium]|nr:radical SAM protein [Endomicrobiaceae bacterium]
MNLLLTTQCLSKCKFCFVPGQLKNKRNEMSFAEFKDYLDRINKIYKKNKPPVGLLGGEPTLAKDFALIIAHSKTYKGGIRLYSNLITERKNIEYMLGAKNMVLVWNVGSYIQAAAKNKSLILKNLSIIKKDFGRNIIASITLHHKFKKQDFAGIIKILKKYDIQNIRIALDATRHKEFITDGRQVYEFIKYLTELSFTVRTSYCGHFVKCMFDKQQEKYLKEHIENFNYNDCSVNYPIDILPGGQVVPCMKFANRQSKLYLLNYTDLKKLKNDIKKKFKINITPALCIKCKLKKNCGKLCTQLNENKK